MPTIPYRYAVALVTAIGLFMAVLNNTVVNVALVPMQESFGIGLSQAQWIITSYFLVQAAVIPVAGYLGLWFGSKLTYLVFLGIFVVGSIACAASTLLPESLSFPALVAARVLQGIGGGALFPLATSITFASFRPEDRASASAFISIPVLIAPTLGPAIGGIVVDSPLGWPWIFLLNVPVGLLGIALVARVLRPDAARAADSQAAADPVATRHFDWTGLLSCMAGVVVVVYAFSLVGETRDGSITAESPLGEVNGWLYGPFWGLLVLGLFILGFFTWYELRRAADPVLNLRLYGGRTFRIASVLTWATRGIVFGSFFLLPLFLQQYRGLSAVETGLILGAQGIGAVIGVQVAARLFDRVGPRYIVVGGFAALTASTLWLVLVDATVAYWAFIPILILRGIGFGWSNMPLQTTALAEITGSALPKATSLFNATAQVFSSIGIAVTSTLFLGYVDSHAHLIVQTPEGVDALEAGAQGFRYAFLYLAMGTAIAGIAAFWLPRYSLRQRQEHGDEDALDVKAQGEPSRA
ncbi:MAG TPA: MDR family MFS transporter [Thermomicrobiales bacterium]|jgi:EmrB/QacA subfamily drug resistance transporter|nr:MDR family MFS transporter [Thermomicrobiales bacterium]